MMDDLTIREEEVRRMLREAFADVPCPRVLKDQDACGPLSHDDWLELRRDFYNYDPEVIQYMIPLMLEDAMDTRTGDDTETGDMERLVLELDPFELDSEVVRRVKLEQFANLSDEQRLAVCEWLRLARTWPDLKMFTDWVDEAIEYWCRRPFEADCD